jgi:hypothetical protein
VVRGVLPGGGRSSLSFVERTDQFSLASQISASQVKSKPHFFLELFALF